MSAFMLAGCVFVGPASLAGGILSILGSLSESFRFSAPFGWDVCEAQLLMLDVEELLEVSWTTASPSAALCFCAEALSIDSIKVFTESADAER
jgi:hypothetical protein